LPGHQEPRPGDEKDSDLAIAAEGASTFSRHLLHVLGWGIALLVVGSVLALVYSAPLGPTFDPDMEVTKPPWIFMPLYPFESWFGLDALLWLPIAVSVVLVLVPAFDRYKSSSLRRRWVMLAAMGVLVLAVIVIGIYGQLSEPAEHIEMGE
jgi:quinol-cytochrome oxidoreductase complex cytochrome b subunit